jgi:predicted DNA-binding ribbon-helix-helix protein
VVKAGPSRGFPAQAPVVGTTALVGRPDFLKVRGFRLANRRTSVSLENEFWEAARTIAAARHMSIQKLIAEIDSVRDRNTNLSSAIRTSVLEYYKSRVDVARAPEMCCGMPPSVAVHGPMEAVSDLG